MYHYVYDANSVPENLNSNYIEVGTLEEELKYLHENDYYFPTWKEVREYLTERESFRIKALYFLLMMVRCI